MAAFLKAVKASCVFEVCVILKSAIGKLEPYLTLADLQNTVHRCIDLLALLTRRSTDKVLYNRDRSRFGDTDTLDEGKSGNDAPISRIRHTSATRLSERLGTNNARELEIAIDRQLTLPVQGNIAASRPGMQLLSCCGRLSQRCVMRCWPVGGLLAPGPWRKAWRTAVITAATSPQMPTPPSFPNARRNATCCNQLRLSPLPQRRRYLSKSRLNRQLPTAR